MILKLPDKFLSQNALKVCDFATTPLSSAEAPAGYPYKNSNNRKTRKRAEDDGKMEKVGASLLSFPFPSCPARSLFLSPRRGLFGGESYNPYFNYHIVLVTFRVLGAPHSEKFSQRRKTYILISSSYGMH